MKTGQWKFAPHAWNDFLYFRFGLTQFDVEVQRSRGDQTKISDNLSHLPPMNTVKYTLLD